MAASRSRAREGEGVVSVDRRREPHTWEEFPAADFGSTNCLRQLRSAVAVVTTRGPAHLQCSISQTQPGGGAL
jgi:hypothetical protein